MTNPTGDEHTLVVNGPSGERRFALQPGVAYVIGRSTDCAIHLAEPFVSRRHAELVPGGAGWSFRQLGQGNPTLLRGQPVTETALVADDSYEIRGPTGELLTLQYVAVAAAPAAPPPPPPPPPVATPPAAPAPAPVPPAPVAPAPAPEPEPEPARSQLVAIETTPNELRAHAGTQAVFSVGVENRSNEAQALSVEVHGLPPAWVTVEFDAGLKAFPKESRQGTLTVAVPEDAASTRISFRVVGWAGSEQSSVECSLQVVGSTAEPQQQAAPSVALLPSDFTVERGSGEEVVSLVVRNVGDSDADYVITVPRLDESWYTAPATLSVPAGQALDTELRFRAPASAEAGVYAFSVEVVLAGSPDVATDAPGQLNVESPAVPQLLLAPSQLSIRRGADGRITLNIRNTGALEHDYAVSVDGLPDGWSVPSARLRVAPDQALDTELRIAPAADAPFGEYAFAVRVALEDMPDIAAEQPARITITTPEGASTPPTPAAAAGQSGEASSLIEPPSVSLEPSTDFRFSGDGSMQEAVIAISNVSRMAERYQIEVQGLPDGWYRLVTDEVELAPGAKQSVPLRLQPSVDPANPPGEYTLRIRVAPYGYPDALAEIVGRLHVSGAPGQ